MLDMFEKKLAAAEFPYTRRPDGTLVWPYEGNYVVHPVVISDESRGRLRAEVSFPLPVVCDTNEFCDIIADRLVTFSEHVRLERMSASCVIEMCVYAPTELLSDRVQDLCLLADDVHALLEHIRENAHLTGWWDENLIGLAFLANHQCWGRA